jgi:hypothetical protein
MAAISNEPTRWKPVTLSSAAVLTICLAFGYIDVGTHFRFDLPDYSYGSIFVAGAAAALCFCISVIAWAKHVGRQGRVSLALAVLLWPWAVLLIGYPFGGTNIHGPAAPVMVMIWPTSILSLVLFIMAGVAERDT